VYRRRAPWVAANRGVDARFYDNASIGASRLRFRSRRRRVDAARLLVLLAAAATVATAVVIAAGLLGGNDGKAESVIVHARLVGPDPLTFDPSRTAAYERAAAFGLSHVLFAKSPGGVARTAKRTARFRPLVEKAVAGTGLDPDTVVGPLVSPEHLERVTQHVVTGMAEGARLVTGGQRLDRAGNFFAPTVFGQVTDEMTIAREEIFGPVLAILSYEDPDELAARANDSDYGLAACVWTRDLSVAHRLAATIRAGSVYVNLPPFLDPASPWGGFGASGWGREMGEHAIDEFTETKSVWIELS